MKETGVSEIEFDSGSFLDVLNVHRHRRCDPFGIAIAKRREDDFMLLNRLVSRVGIECQTQDRDAQLTADVAKCTLQPSVSDPFQQQLVQAQIGGDEALGILWCRFGGAMLLFLKVPEVGDQLVGFDQWDGESSIECFERRAEVEKFGYRLTIELGDEESATGVDFDEADLAKAIKGFADRRPTDAEFAGQRVVGESCPGCEFEIDDTSPHRVVDRVREIGDLEWSVIDLAVKQVAEAETGFFGHDVPDVGVSGLDNCVSHTVYDCCSRHKQRSGTHLAYTLKALSFSGAHHVDRLGPNLW